MKCNVTFSALRRVRLCSQDELVTSAGLLFPSLFLDCPNALKTLKLSRCLSKAASRNRTGYHTFYFWKYNISLHFILNDMITLTSPNKEVFSWQWHNRTTGKHTPCLSRRMFTAKYTTARYQTDLAKWNSVHRSHMLVLSPHFAFLFSTLKS
jgi:hypothetical protein